MKNILFENLKLKMYVFIQKSENIKNVMDK